MVLLSFDGPTSTGFGPSFFEFISLKHSKSFSSAEGVNCEKHEDLDYLAHINTPNLARDLELIRDLMEYDEMDLWGISFGSVIATAYAAMFPDTCGSYHFRRSRPALCMLTYSSIQL